MVGGSAVGDGGPDRRCRCRCLEHERKRVGTKSNWANVSSHTRQAVTLSPNNSTHCKILPRRIFSAESTPQPLSLLTAYPKPVPAHLRKLPPPTWAYPLCFVVARFHLRRVHADLPPQTVCAQRPPPPIFDTTALSPWPPTRPRSPTLPRLLQPAESLSPPEPLFHASRGSGTLSVQACQVSPVSAASPMHCVKWCTRQLDNGC